VTSETDGEKKKENVFSSLIDSSDVASTAVGLIKRFFYQALGIYTPASLLVIYLMLFWNGGLLPFLAQDLPDWIKDNTTFIVIIFILGILVIGEAINSITSYISTLSPLKLSIKNRLKFQFRRSPISIWSGSKWSGSNPLIYVSRERKWPVWLNETYYPVPFAIFDRFYLTTLDADKKALAGKIGWVAFYRNLVAVLGIIMGLRFLDLSFETENGNLFAKSLNLVSPSSLNTFDSLFLIVTFVLIIAFYLAYKAQINANKDILWNAYRRNELKKNLEARFGDLTAILGIADKYKKVAEDYILNCWFLAAEYSLRDVSGAILTRAEIAYRTEFDRWREDRTRIHQSLTDESWFYLGRGRALRNEKTLDYCRTQLLRASKYWHDGGYEMVIDTALTIMQTLGTLKFSDGGKGKTRVPFSLNFWRMIKGLYLFTDIFYADAVYKQISKEVSNWGWVYPISGDRKHKDGEPVKDSLAQDYFWLKETKISESFDPYVTAMAVVSKTINLVNEIRNKKEKKLTAEEETVYFRILDRIYVEFGGYNYDRALDMARRLYDYLQSPFQNTAEKLYECLLQNPSQNIEELYKYPEPSLAEHFKQYANKKYWIRIG
jgi:hypothetical protein